MFFKSHALKSRTNGRLVSRPTHKCDMARPIQKHPEKRPAIIPRSSQDAGSTLIRLLLGYFLGRWPQLLHPVASGRGPASTMSDIHHPQIFTLRRQSDGVVIVAWAPPGSRFMPPTQKGLATVREQVFGRSCHGSNVTRTHLTMSHFHVHSASIVESSTFSS